MASARRLIAAVLAPLLASACYQGSGDASTGASDAGTTAGTGDGSGAGTGTGPGTGGPTSAGTTDPTTGAGTGTGGPTSATSSTGPDDMSTGPGPVDTGPDTTGSTTGEPVDPVAEVCGRFNGDRADLSEGTWSGDVNGCNPGDTGAPGRDNALRLVNLYRWLADLPPVMHDAGRNGKAQECALMMHANGQLSHDPPADWECYTAGGAEAAGNSNISGTPGVTAVDLYMVDPGNSTTFGHRRWLLSNSLGPIGLGSTSMNSCLWVIGGQGNGGKAWMSWPAPGIVPIEAIHVPQIGWANVDETGWTIQSDTIDVSQAQVTISEGGVDRPVKLTPLQQYFGSMYAIAMTPQGWVSEAGKTYTVQVNGVPAPFSYEVQVVQCE